MIFTTLIDIRILDIALILHYLFKMLPYIHHLLDCNHDYTYLDKLLMSRAAHM